MSPEHEAHTDGFVASVCHYARGLDPLEAALWLRGAMRELTETGNDTAARVARLRDELKNVIKRGTDPRSN